MPDLSITNPTYQPLTDQQLSDLDEHCDRFERELVDDCGPRIETFLAATPKAAQDSLLAELLAIEIEYRIRQGDPPGGDEYVQRFPQQECVVARVFARDTTTQFADRGTTSFPASVPPVMANFRLIEEIGRGGSIAVPGAMLQFTMLGVFDQAAAVEALPLIRSSAALATSSRPQRPRESA